MEEKKMLFCSGHSACAGCPVPIALKHILSEAGPNTIVSNATSCSEIISTPYPYSAWKIPYIHTAFECSAAVASGIESALKKMDKNANVIVIAGDGGTYDIGLQSLSGMVDRGHNVLYICYDNECYANTGIQRSSATPYAAWTTTSPSGTMSVGNETFKKPIAEMMAAQGAVYVATSSIAYPKDIQNKVKKALSIKGPKFMVIHAPCPIAWRFKPSETVNIGKLAVETGMWVLFEIENGRVTINKEPGRKDAKGVIQSVPVSEYLKPQGRFKHVTDKEIEKIQKRVDEDWKKYKELQDAKVRL
jgi:pyruvate ferredoxin oxidoreductase beta subunit